MANRKGYVFDRDSLVFRKKGMTIGSVLKFLAIFATSSVTFTLIVYLIFSFFFNTK